MMDQLVRHDWLLQYLEQHGSLSVRQAVELLNVSPATVRRDFSEFAAKGLAQRARGGIRLERSASMPPFDLRQTKFSAEKQALADYAASLIQPGQVLFIDGGTTTFHLSNSLPEHPLRVVTNSVRLAVVLDERARNRHALELFLTGGLLSPHSGLLVGPGAKSTLAHYHADWAFLAAGGINESGLFNTNEMVADGERLMIANANKVAVLADHSKIGIHAMCHVCALDQINLLITDYWPENAGPLKAFESQGIIPRKRASVCDHQ